MNAKPINIRHEGIQVGKSTKAVSRATIFNMKAEHSEFLVRQGLSEDESFCKMEILANIE